MRRFPRRWQVVAVAAAVMGGAGTYQFVWSSVSGVVGGTVAGTLVVALGWSASFYLGAVLLVLAGLCALALRPVQFETLSRATSATDD